MDSNIEDKQAPAGTLQLAGVECNSEQNKLDNKINDAEDKKTIEDKNLNNAPQVSKNKNDELLKNSTQNLQNAMAELLQAQKCLGAWKEEHANLPLSKQIEILQNVFKKLNVLKKSNKDTGNFDFNWKRFAAADVNAKKRNPQADEIQEKEHNKFIAMKQKISSENTNENEQNEDIQRPIAVEKLTAAEEHQDNIYRKSGEIFLQNVPCYKLRSHLGNFITEIPVCRECHKRHINSSKPVDVYCRFYEFRRLRYEPNGQLIVAGFPNPHYDPKQVDINIWKPDQNTHPTAGYMDIQICRLILLHIGDQFCYLWRQEAEAFLLHENPYDIIAWKKAVQGIREICDVCDTTVFNYHWTCAECGFTVCLDCYKDRKEKRSCSKVAAVSARSERGRDEFHWLLCVSKSCQNPPVKHELSGLMLTQIITGDALNVLGRKMHELRALWQVPQSCDCLLSNIKFKNNKRLNKMIKELIDESQLQQRTVKSSLATKETARLQAEMECMHADKVKFAKCYGIKNYVPGHEWNTNGSRSDPITTAFDKFQHINMYRQGLAGLRRFIPPRTMTMTQSESIIKNVPHEWLCHGKLLRLTNPICPDNRILFQKVWKCGQPVVVSDVDRSLDLNIWRPEAFCRDFGHKPNDLINCLTGNLVPNQPMHHFWEGFQSMQKRLLDANGEPMLLKLKDWPPGDDFAEILPTRFTDLMKGLPMPEYTLRTGNLNLASCLPKMFVPPDLGPKMYNAYGSALYPDRGTTNLHLDISDAVNIMVYVGIPSDSDCSTQLAATQHAIAMGGCDFYTRLRVQRPDVLPGALWHIFAARDADKIRDLLNRVTLENGFRLEPNHDPIHDQNWYLDDKLRARLFSDYGVQGYPIVQCLGDAVFIPAGAPHQVQNLHNCIKVAEDFVSPENITHCYHLTYEFRRLSHSHTNHEDKLQIKNIIYHAVKDCCTILSRALYDRYSQYVMNKYDSKYKFAAGNQRKNKAPKCHTHVHIVHKSLREKFKNMRKNAVRKKKATKRKMLNEGEDLGENQENNANENRISEEIEVKEASLCDEINDNLKKFKNNEEITTRHSIDQTNKMREEEPPPTCIDMIEGTNMNPEKNTNSQRRAEHSCEEKVASADIQGEMNLNNNKQNK